MRWTVVLLGVAVMLVLGVGPASAKLSYSFTFDPELTTSSTSGTVSGTLGGVAVTGTYSGTLSSATLTLKVGGATFASGTYACTESGCTFTGTVAGKSVTGATLNPDGTITSSVFPNHGAWVSAVAHWANTNLSGVERGRVVSSAAKSNKPQASLEAGTQSVQGSGHGRGNAHGKGGGKP